jgi:small conductance mechanosensitive channel
MPNSQDTLQDTLNNSVSQVVKVLEHPDQLLNAGFWLEAKDFLIQFGINLGTAILILIVGFWIAKQVRLGLTRLFQKKEIEPSLQTFLRSLISILIKVMVK